LIKLSLLGRASAIGQAPTTRTQRKRSPFEHASLHKWDESTEADAAMFAYYDTAAARRTIIKSNDDWRAPHLYAH